MKKLYFLAFLLFPLFHLHSQTANISLLENDYNHLLVDVVTPDFSVSEVSCQDTKYALLDMPGYLLATQVGAPSIPVGGTMIEIPVCSQVKVFVLLEDIQMDGLEFITMDSHVMCTEAFCQLVLEKKM